MKINHSTQNTFNGIYLVKGNGRQIAEASRKIYQRCSNPEAKNITKFTEQLFEEKTIPPKPIKNFTSCFCEMLTELYGDKQPLVQMLVATNEDSKIIEGYYDKLFAMSGVENIEELDQIHLEIFKRRVDKFFKKNAENFIEYNQAQKKCIETGNASTLANFILKRAIVAKNKLNEILIPYNKKEADIITLRAEDVLMAIEQDSFDYINGIYKYNKTTGLD